MKMLEEENSDFIYTEKFTGTKMDRKEFNKLLDVLEEGDTLVVTKLDRFARSVRGGIEVIRQLFDMGVRVHVLNMGVIENTPTGRLIFNIMMSFAEFERDMIVERTQEGKMMARQDQDFREGRPKKYSSKQINHAIELKKNHTYKKVEDLTGISKPTLYRAMLKGRIKKGYKRRIRSNKQNGFLFMVLENPWLCRGFQRASSVG